MPHKNTLRSLILRVPDALPGPRVRPVPSLARNTFAGIADRDSNFFPSVSRIIESVLDSERVTGDRAPFIPVIFHYRGDETKGEAETGSLLDGGGGELSRLIEFHEPLHFTVSGRLIASCI